jgi:hypothetical protein
MRQKGRSAAQGDILAREEYMGYILKDRSEIGIISMK